jgi:predicted Zn-dependent protease
MGRKPKPSAVFGPKWRAEGGGRLRLAVTAVTLSLVGVGCASSVAIPKVSKLERQAVETELGGASRAELERDESLRFWEVFLSDATVVAGFDDSQRALLEHAPIRGVAEVMHAAFQAQTGAQVVELMRLSPSLLREAASQADLDTRSKLLAVASTTETLQSVVHRRIEAVGGRVLLAAGRPEIRVVPDASVGLNAAAPVRFGASEVYIGTELAVVTANDDELACAIGHEVAHITEGHTSSGAWAEVGKKVLTGIAAGAALAAMAYANQGYPLTQGQIDGALAMGQLTRFALADVPLRVAGWERGQEREADAVGLYYAWKAGFAPESCSDTIVRIAHHAKARGEPEGFWWWNTHPVSAERVVSLRKLAASARAGTLERR